MTTPTTDALVVGAGPAGCAAALELARVGCSVVVVDRARFPRDKCCGDGLTTGALRRLESLGLDPGAVASFTELSELAVRSPSGRVAALSLHSSARPGCYAAVARRTDLDAAVVALTASACEVREEDGLAAIDKDPEGVVATLQSGARVRARHLVAADGAWSPVRRALRAQGQGDQRRDEPIWYAFRAYARNVDAAALERLWVLFEESLLPGYAWAFPVGEAVNVGICCARPPGTRGAALAAAWDEVMRDGFVQSLLGRRAVLEGAPRAWPIPAGISREQLSGGGSAVLFAGDAARAADPFTGEGIAQALETGALAAGAIAAHLGDRRAAARAYKDAAWRALGHEHAIAWRLRRLLSTSLGARAAVRASGANRLTERAVGRWLYEDYPRSIAISPHLWRRGALSRPAPWPVRSERQRGGGEPGEAS